MTNEVKNLLEQSEVATTEVVQVEVVETLTAEDLNLVQGGLMAYGDFYPRPHHG